MSPLNYPQNETVLYYKQEKKRIQILINNCNIEGFVKPENKVLKY